MRPELIAAPALFSVCHADPATWLQSAVRWREELQALGLRPHLPIDHWTAAVADECLPTIERIRAMLGPEQRSVAPAALHILAALLALFDPRAPDVVVYRWDATGCLREATCRNVVSEVVALAASLYPRAVGILGTPRTEEEDVGVELLEDNDEDLTTRSLEFPVGCFDAPDALLAHLDEADFSDRPLVAVALALSRMQVPAARVSRFHALPQLAVSLSGLNPSVKRSAIQTMAQVLLPPEARPRGIEEHVLRSGPGPEDQPKRGNWGTAYRATVRKRGTGWRLHYWRGDSTVTFSNVCPHESSEIFS